MPFLAPVAAPLIATGGSLLGSALFGRPSKEDKLVKANQTQSMQLGQQMSQRLQPQGQSLINQGQQAFSPTIDYWSRLLAPTRAGMTSTLAPEIGRIGEGYQAAQQQAAELTPRGGGRASLLAQAPYQQQRDVSTILQQARPQAAAGLLGAGQAAAGAGNAIIANAIQALYGSTSAGRSILDYQAQQKQQQQQAGGAIGNFLFNALKNADFSFGGKSKGSGTATGGPLGEFP